MSNNFLFKKEEEILQEVTRLFGMRDEIIKDQNPFTIDFMVEAEIDYYVKGNDNPSHTFSNDFYSKYLTSEKSDSPIYDRKYDWRESFLPEREMPCCYLMCDLMTNSRISNIQDIYMLWINMKVTEQQGLTVKKDWHTKTIKFKN